MIDAILYIVTNQIIVAKRANVKSREKGPCGRTPEASSKLAKILAGSTAVRYLMSASRGFGFANE